MTKRKGKIENGENKLSDKYWCFLDRKIRPLPEEMKEIMARELIAFSEKDNAYKISQFFSKYRMTRQQFYDLVTDSPILKAAVEVAKINIGDRREIGALNFKLNQAVVLPSMARYDPEWKAEEERRAVLAKDKEGDNRVTVVLEAFPSSDKVKPKEIEEKNEFTRLE